jgi:16S rRNA (uracil1498-N3)-methyltransferase
MGREHRRLLIDPGRLQPAAAGLVGLTPAESRYLVKVLRYGPGAMFAICDGAGGLWEAELVEPGWAQLRQPPGEPLAWQPPPTPPLVLLAALV